ncbi:MAG: hypothetical protein JWP02_182 [Acidimicrobiales bacterium]|nr:hypothetical protein [Acidimicrobiales bacterium]
MLAATAALAVLVGCSCSGGGGGGAGGGGGGTTFPRDRTLRLNQIQVRGTHNSYHPPLPPLDVQLDAGMRQLELDVFSVGGGRFAVHHTPTDTLSSCADLAGCLAVVRRWMDVHRAAAPLFLIIEDKDPVTPDAASQLDALDAAVRTGIGGPRRLVLPDSVLPVARRGWPSLGAVRGRAAAVLLGPLADSYSRSGTSLTGRAMFVYAGAGPLAAITSRPDPVAQAGEIAVFVRAGLIVRTQTDDGLFDVRRRLVAADTGAQLISAADTSYQLPGNVPWRCDPLLVPPARCHPSDVEHLPTTATTPSSAP